MIGIIGVLTTAFFLIKKKWQSLENISLILIGLSFLILALSRFFIFNFAYYGYYGLMLISIIGVLLLSVKGKKSLTI